jgi:arabinogalactan oligomer / maltooligosaccharide transport system substrate-binding protein
VEDPRLVDAVTERGTAYTASTGVVIEVRLYEPPSEPPAEGEATDLLSALTLDQLDAPADLYVGPHTWALQLAEAGRAEPVFLADGLVDSIVQSVSPRGYPLAIPLAVDGVVQVRNRALMPEAPESVETIPCPDADRCLLLPADGDADIHYPFLVALGGYLFGPDTAGGYDVDDLGVASEESIAGATILQTLITAGTVDPVADEAAGSADFAAGNAALIWVHASSLDAARDSGMDISVEPLPTIGGNPPVVSFRTLAAFINPFGSAKSEALAFATDWLGDVSGSGAIALATGTAPVRPEAAVEAMAMVLESVTTGDPVPPVADIDRIWFEVSDAFRRIYAGTTPEDAMFGALDDIR